MFYLPHNLDFRGRAYVIPPYISHLGNDFARGLLKFAEQKPLGEHGLAWLKIHLANVYGKDKYVIVLSLAHSKLLFDRWHDVLHTLYLIL